MTISNIVSTVTHDGNGVTTQWPYGFEIPDDESKRVGLFEIATNVLTELADSDYTISGIGDPDGGEVDYPLVGAPLTATHRIVIWREVPLTQEVDLTNQTPYYPEVLETSLDRLTMMLQQLSDAVDRSIKVTLGSNLTPDEFVAALQEGAAVATAAAVAAAASAAAAAASAGSIDLPAAPNALDYIRRNAGNTAYENRSPAQAIVDLLGEPATFTLAQAGQARANIGANLLTGTRSPIINGNFDVWQRGSSLAASATTRFLADRWLVAASTSTAALSRQTFALGQTDVPGNPKYFHRTVVASVAGAANAVIMGHRIEDVSKLSGGVATLTFYAKADAPKNMSVELQQMFGTGGSPSAAVTAIGVTKVALTAAWQRFNVLVTIPSVAGKTLGTNNNDLLQVGFWFDAGSDYNARTDSLGQQSGTFDIAHVSLVPGDARAEDDPYPPVPAAQTIDLCRWYYERLFGALTANEFGSGLCFSTTLGIVTIHCQPKRTLPTVLFGTATNFLVRSGGLSGQAVSSMTATGSASGIISIQATTSGLTIGQGAMLVGTSQSAFIEVDSEL